MNLYFCLLSVIFCVTRTGVYSIRTVLTPLKGKYPRELDYKWDGLKGYITNTRLTGNEVIDNYNNLWKIERAFRISKTDLKIRPIYHRLRERIEAHICISFVSYLMYKELERVLLENNSQISVKKAIKSINKMYEVVIDRENCKTQSILLGKNAVHQEIIGIVNHFF